MSTAKIQIIDSIETSFTPKKIISIKRTHDCRPDSGPSLRVFTDIAPTSFLYTYYLFSLIILISFSFWSLFATFGVAPTF